MDYLKSLTPESNLSLYALPIAFGLVLMPHVQKILVLQSAGIKIDNRAPRTVDAVAEKKGCPAPVRAKAQRLAAAHANGHENFPVFAAAVLSGVVAGVGAGEMNVFAGAYLACRLGYNVAYATQTTQLGGAVRSLLFWTGTGWCLGIMVSAAGLLAKK